MSSPSTSRAANISNLNTKKSFNDLPAELLMKIARYCFHPENAVPDWNPLGLPEIIICSLRRGPTQSAHDGELARMRNYNTLDEETLTPGLLRLNSKFYKATHPILYEETCFSFTDDGALVRWLLAIGERGRACLKHIYVPVPRDDEMLMLIGGAFFLLQDAKYLQNIYLTYVTASDCPTTSAGLAERVYAAAGAWLKYMAQRTGRKEAGVDMMVVGLHVAFRLRTRTALTTGDYVTKRNQILKEVQDDFKGRMLALMDGDIREMGSLRAQMQ